MNYEQLDKVSGSQPFIYNQAVQDEEGSKSRWQVDTRELRVFLEHNLKGEKEIEVIYTLYKILNYDDKKLLGEFFATDDKSAKTKYVEWLRNQEKFSDECIFQKTDKYEYVREWVRVKEPLVNDVGAYHLLSVIDPIFSQVGYMSKLDKNEIKDIIWDNVIVTLVLSMAQNYERYGIRKSSREEIIALFDSIVNLILNASEEGFTAKGMRESVREFISTQGNDSKKMFKI